MTTLPQRAGSARRSLARQLYAVSLFLVAYGSLYPFHFVRPPSDAEAWNAFITNLSLWTSAGDVVGNVLLCIPLGVLAPSVSGRSHRPRLAAVALFAFNLAWVFGLQVLQIYFPPRDASLSDAFWNTVGILLGWAMAGPLARIAPPPSVSRPRDATVPMCLLVGWLATQLAPFVPSLDWQLVKDALKPLVRDPQWQPVALVFVVARVFAAGVLFDAIVAAPGRRQRKFLTLLVAVLVAKLFIVNQRLTPDNVAGFAIGWVAAVASQRMRPSRRHGVALATLFVAYSLQSLLPFEPRAVPEPMHLLPFDALLQGAMEVNAWSLVEAGFVFGAMLWMGLQSGAAAVGMTVSLAAWVGLMEWLQRWIVGRTSDLTMPLLVIAIGFVLRRLDSAALPSRSGASGLPYGARRPYH